MAHPRSPAKQPPLLSELRRVPPSVAILVVAIAAAITMILFSAAETVLRKGGSNAPAAAHPARQVPRRPAAAPRPAPKAHPAPAAAPTPAPRQAGPSTPLSRLVGAKIIARMSGTQASQALLRQVRLGHVGGVILFPDNIASAPQLRALTASLQRAARSGGGNGVVIAIDQEGGPVKRLSGPPYHSPAALATPGAAEREGVATGRYLAGLGINVDFAPVLDVRRAGGFIASRTFASTPGEVASLGDAFARGLHTGGVWATAKHFPGLGRATANTDLGPSVVSAPRATLETEMAPFRTAIDSGDAGLIMMSTATYPAFDGRPAALSPPLIGYLRRTLGFSGVIVTDDLDGAAVRNVASPSAAAVSAARAGADMVLLAQDPAEASSAYRALADAAKRRVLSRPALEASYARVARLTSASGAGD